MHFSLLVIGESVEERIMPFCCENQEDNIDEAKFIEAIRKALGILKTKDSIRYGQEARDYLKELNITDVLQKDNDNLIKFYDLNHLKLSYLFSDIVWPDEDDYRLDEDISRYDWYEIGGRWAGSIILKDSVDAVSHDSEYNDEPNFSWGWKQEDKDLVMAQGGVDSAYKKDIANLDKLPDVCYSLLTENDEWYDEDNSNFKLLVQTELENIDDDTRITIVDCHI